MNRPAVSGSVIAKGVKVVIAVLKVTTSWARGSSGVGIKGGTITLDPEAYLTLLG